MKMQQALQEAREARDAALAESNQRFCDALDRLALVDIQDYHGVAAAQADVDTASEAWKIAYETIWAQFDGTITQGQGE